MPARASSTTPPDQVRVLFIGGYGRSGSTLLDRLLGQIEGFVSVGELRNLWEEGVKQNLLCGCGSPTKECPFWTQVLEHAFGPISKIDVDRLIYLRSRFEGRPSILSVLFPGPASSRFNEEHLEYLGAMERLYKAIAHVSGARLIVDSSKHPGRGFLLATIPSVQLCAVHLIRDSRAVTYSWQRTRIRPDVIQKTTFMNIHGTLQSVAEWMGHNRLTASLGRRAHCYTVVRYDDLVANPRDVLSRIVTSIGEPAPDLSFLGERQAYLKPNHTVSGNPMRFSHGWVPISLDDEWRSSMPFGKKLLVTACTWPWLLRYGFQVF
jgi:hypothetical protein